MNSRRCGRPTQAGGKCRRKVAPGNSCPESHRDNATSSVPVVGLADSAEVASADPFAVPYAADDARNAQAAVKALNDVEEWTTSQGFAVLSALERSGASSTDSPEFSAHLAANGIGHAGQPRVVVADGGSGPLSEWVVVTVDGKGMIVSCSHMTREVLVFRQRPDGQREDVEVGGSPSMTEGVADAVNLARAGATPFVW